jgi:signal transduction histidine kinase
MKNNSPTPPITTIILWAVFVSLLAVLLPHTAWAFRKFEPTGSETVSLFPIFGITITSSDLISYIAAFAFESAIAVLVHKLSEHLGKKLPKEIRKDDKWYPVKAFVFRYVNPISFALIIVTAVSALANLAHAVEYGQTLAIFARLGVPSEVYTFAFGAILPLLSLTFANVLSNVTEDEAAPNPEVEEAKKTILTLRQQIRESEAKMKDAEARLKAAEDRARLAEERFGAMGDLVKHLFGEDKRQRILIVKKQWPELKQSAIAVIAGSRESYVSEVLKAENIIDA